MSLVPLVGRGEFRIIEARARTNAAIILRELLPDGLEIESGFIAQNPLRPNDGALCLYINPRTATWADHQAGVSETGFIALVAYLRGLTLGEAAGWLMGTCDRAERRCCN